MNVPFPSLEDYRAQVARARQACIDIGRDPDDLTMSVALVVCCGENDAQVEQRAGNIGRAADELRANGAAGTPPEVLATLADFAEAGASRVYLQVLDMGDLEHLELLGEQVLRLLP